MKGKICSRAIPAHLHLNSVPEWRREKTRCFARCQIETDFKLEYCYTQNSLEQRVKVIGKNDFTLTKTVTILFVHERGNSVHASRGYAARSVPEFPRS